ncbi:hypothetical protein ACOCJ7_04910 [Knoellia sp. CPCC 206453]|uniref:hypothetical protein n=1 Tax=Knoellia pratensis TaxID=3404796 RepID=UPI00361BA634
MNDVTAPQWSDWTGLTKDQRRAILRGGVGGSLPRDPRMAAIAIMWAREWPRRAAARGVLVPTAAAVIAVLVDDRVLQVIGWAGVALGIVGLVVEAARRLVPRPVSGSRLDQVLDRP